MQMVTKVVEVRIESESKKCILCRLLISWLKIESESKNIHEALNTIVFFLSKGHHYKN